jgi:hypothetical protein
MKGDVFHFLVSGIVCPNTVREMYGMFYRAANITVLSAKAMRDVTAVAKTLS